VTDMDWNLAETLLDELLLLDESERTDRLEAIKRSFPDVASTVCDWLAAMQRRGGFLEIVPGEVLFHLQENTIVDKWRLRRPLGRGGMGEVWLAERSDGAFEKCVAIKFIRSNDERLRTALENERRLLAQLDHPGIARLLDGGVTQAESPYLVIEYIDGHAIGQWCKTHDATLRQRLNLFREVCEAVAYAHASLIVHRDIKPGNILVDGEGHARLLDFGIARVLRPEGGATHPNTVHNLTPDYAAPEQLTGAAITTRTDVYALGGLLYFLLCGRAPLETRNLPMAALVKRICEELPIPPSRGQDAPVQLFGTVAGDLDAIALKALAKMPSERYTSVEALIADIDNTLNWRPVSARRTSYVYRMRRYAWRHRFPLGIGAALILSLIGGLFGTLWQAKLVAQQRDLASAQRDLAEQRSIALRGQSNQNKATIDFMVALLGNATPNNESIKVTDLLAAASSQALSEKMPSEKLDALIAVLARIYGERADAQGIETFLLPLLRETGDRLSPEVFARAACLIANAEEILGNIPEQRKWVDAGLARSTGLPANSRSPHPGCLAAKANLLVYSDKDFPAAFALLRQAIAEIQSDPGESIDDYGKELSELEEDFSLRLFDAANLKEARIHAQNALNARLASGASNSDIASTRAVLSRCDSALGNPLRANQEQSREPDVTQKSSGATLPEVIQLADSAKYKIELADGQGALRALDQEEKFLRGMMGDKPSFYDVVIAQQRGRAYGLLRQEMQSQEQFSLAKDLSERVLGQQSIRTFIVLSETETLAMLNPSVERAQQALSRMLDLQSDLIKKDGESAVLYRFMIITAEIAIAAGNFEIAAEQAARSRAIYVEKGADDDSAYLARCDIVLAQAKLHAGDHAAALALSEAAARHMETSLGPRHPRTLQAHALADSVR
jgi:eukaryotic-like serine/threonine-protein kinase